MTTNHQNSYEATIALLREFPQWRGVVAAALEEAQTIPTGRFAGKWVLDRAKKHGITWIPNLRKLSSYGIVQKEGESTRSGTRAYYTMPDMDGVARALRETSRSTSEPYATHYVTETGVTRRAHVPVPYYATLASCGSPNMTEAVVDDIREVDAQFIKSGHSYFLVQADGDSMDQAGIKSGDLLLVRVQNYADAGQKVVACVDGGVTVKELQNAGEYSILVPRSSNPANKPVMLSEDSIIQGVVVTVLPANHS